MTFFVRPIIRPPANLYKNDGGGGGGEGGVQNSCIPKWPNIEIMITRILNKKISISEPELEPKPPGAVLFGWSRSQNNYTFFDSHRSIFKRQFFLSE